MWLEYRISSQARRESRLGTCYSTSYLMSARVFINPVLRGSNPVPDHP